MNLLVIETSGARSIVVLRRDDGRLDLRPFESGARHGRLLIPKIREMLLEAAIGPREVDAIGVGLGPGSFTGLRVGVAAAKAMAYAIGCPLVGVSSLEVLARSLPAITGSVHVVVNAYRGDVFGAEFRRDALDSPLKRITPDRLLPIERWAGDLSEGAVVLCPDPDRIEREVPTTATLRAVDDDAALARSLADLALEALLEGPRVDPLTLEPTYLRKSAAEEKRENAHLGAGDRALDGEAT